MTERLSPAVISYQQTYTRAYLSARWEPVGRGTIKRVSVHVSLLAALGLIEQACSREALSGVKKYVSEGVGQCALFTAEIRFSQDNRSTYTRLARETNTVTTFMRTQRFQNPFNTSFSQSS